MAHIAAPRDGGAVDPIAIGEELAQSQDWPCDRIGEDGVAIVVDATWRVLFVALMWSRAEGLLRLTCSFDLKPASGRLLSLLEATNRINECCWEGAFTLCSERGLVVYRNVLAQDEQKTVNWRHIDALLNSAIERCDRFFPVLQAANMGHSGVGSLLRLVIAEPVGRS